MNDSTEHLSEDQPAATPAERQPSAIDLTIRDLARNAKYFAAVAAGNGADKSTPEYKAFRDRVIEGAIGSAIGIGKLYRRKEAAGDAPLGEQVKAFERDARWLAAAAADNLQIDKNSEAYKGFADRVVDSAIAAAVAHGRFKAPTRSYAEKIEGERTGGPVEGRTA